MFLWFRTFYVDFPHIIQLNAFEMHFFQFYKYFFWVLKISSFFFNAVLSYLSYELSFDSSFIFPNFHVISIFNPHPGLTPPFIFSSRNMVRRVPSDSALPCFLGLCAEHLHLYRCWSVSSVGLLGPSGMFF